jgi:hypothetical protein
VEGEEALEGRDEEAQDGAAGEMLAKSTRSEGSDRAG